MRTRICLLLLFFAFACTKPRCQHEITIVELSRSGAWSDYGGSINIDTSLTYKYYGDYSDVKQGYFIGKVSSQFWDTLNKKLEGIKYKTLPVTDSATAVDINYYELIIHWKNGERKISRMEEHPADSVFKVIYWIDSSYRKMTLHRVKDTIAFESNFHRPMPRILNSVKFPPPILQKYKAYKHIKQR